MKTTRKERERQRHRREILDAAERVFVRSGFHSATVEQIAQEAEFAVGTIYNFFKGKEELYTRVIEKLAQGFMDMFETDVLTIEDPDQALAALIRLRLAYFEDHRGFARVFFETSPESRLNPGRSLPENCKEIYSRYIAAVTGVFERGVRQGRFEGIDPLYLALCLEGIISAFVSYWAENEPAESLSIRVDKMTVMVLDWLKVNSTTGDDMSSGAISSKQTPPRCGE